VVAVESSESLINRGVTFLDAGDHPSAIDCFRKAFADPNNKDSIYMLNTSAFRSVDGGKTLTNIGSGTHGDHHDFWIDPDDSNHVMLANDGGGAVSYDVTSAERHWTGQEFPTAQFYHVITTTHVPYHVCGAQQDNTTACVSSQAPSLYMPGRLAARPPLSRSPSAG